MEKEQCPECERGLLEKKKVAYYLYGEKIGTFPAQVCTKCNAEFFTEDQDNAIEKKVKDLGLWGLETETKVRQTGSSVGITLPKKIQDFFHLKKGKSALLIPVDKHTLQIKM